jgi:hypothetical protein
VQQVERSATISTATHLIAIMRKLANLIPYGKLNMNKYDKEEIVDKYTIHGVPSSLIKEMCKELNVNEDKFWEFMSGQTCGLVGNESLIYPCDIKRFINGLPNLD